MRNASKKTYMKQVIVVMSIFSIVTMKSAESSGIRDQRFLQIIFTKEINVHYKRINSELETCAPEGSKQRDREENWIVEGKQRNDDFKHFLTNLSAQELFACFQASSIIGQVSPRGQFLMCVYFNPTQIDTVVFDSAQLPRTFAAYLAIVARK